jgi:PAS domain S-box-containing protein
MYEEEFYLKTEELICTQTDLEGIIQYGNPTFSSITGYAESELSQNPHSIIRHPDMPKTIFKLFWDYYLKEGKPVVAYIKNRAKSGRYYWALVMVFPVSDGFISIQIKPQTELSTLIKECYKKLVLNEARTDDFNANHSCLHEQLKLLGYNSYTEFMIHILNLELVKRHELLCQKDNKKKKFESESVPFMVLPTLVEFVQKLTEVEKILQETFSQIDLISKNMLIRTIHLGKIARTAATVSENLQLITGEMRAGSTTFFNHLQTFLNTINHITFDIYIVCFQNEAVSYMENDRQEGVFEITGIQNKQNIINATLTDIENKKNRIKEIEDLNIFLMNILAEFMRISLGMNVICVSGKIEIAHISNHMDIYQENIQDLSDQIKSMKEQNDILKQSLNDSSKMLLRENNINKELYAYLIQLYENHKTKVAE